MTCPNVYDLHSHGGSSLSMATSQTSVPLSWWCVVGFQNKTTLAARERYSFLWLDSKPLKVRGLRPLPLFFRGFIDLCHASRALLVYVSGALP